MKKHFLSVVFLCGTIVLASSCKKDEETTPVAPTVNQPETPAPVANAFFAKVDGSEFSENYLSAVVGGGMIAINASITGQSRAISISVPQDVAAGTYSTTAFGSYRLQYNSGGSSLDNIYVGNPGSITVTSNDQTNKVIKGTFTGTVTPSMGSNATDNHSITEGSFTMNY